MDVAVDNITKEMLLEAAKGTGGKHVEHQRRTL